MNFFLLILLSIPSLFAEDTYRDSSLKKKDAPAFLIKATPTGSEIDDVEYFKKHYSSGKTTYEIKYELHDDEVSVSYSEDGKFLEKEEDRKFSSLKQDVQDKIKAYLKEKLKTYKIHETEIRTTSESSFIDVEVSHDGGKTGLTEYSFSPEGNYVSEEAEGVQAIETLN
ncbi:MAG: hypothetical protein V4598_13655 [Bdellovibrionota bacterium]